MHYYVRAPLLWISFSLLIGYSPHVMAEGGTTEQWSHRKVRTGIYAADPGWWAAHYGFGRQVALSQALVGRSR
jgi:hypothetical protein